MSKKYQIIKSGFTFYEDQNNEYSGLFRYKRDKAEYAWTFGPVTSWGVTVEGGYYGQYKYSRGESVKHGYLGFSLSYYKDLTENKFLLMDYCNVSIYFEVGGGQHQAWTVDGEPLEAVGGVYSGNLRWDVPGILQNYAQYLSRYSDDRNFLKNFYNVISDSKYQREDRLDIHGSLFITDNGLINENTISTLYRDLGISINYYDSYLKNLNKFYADNVPQEWLPTENSYIQFSYIDDITDPDSDIITTDYGQIISNKRFEDVFFKDFQMIEGKICYSCTVYTKKNVNDNYKLTIPRFNPIWDLDITIDERTIDLMTTSDLRYKKEFQGPEGKWMMFDLYWGADQLLKYPRYFSEADTYTYYRGSFDFYYLTYGPTERILQYLPIKLNNENAYSFRLIFDGTENELNEFYVNVLDRPVNEVFHVGETKTIQIQCKLPVQCINDDYRNEVQTQTTKPFYFECYTQNLPEGEEEPFEFSYSFDFIEGHKEGYVVSPYEGIVNINITCKHKRFTSDNKIYIGLAPYITNIVGQKFYRNLGHENIPFDEISYLSEFYIDIPEGTKFEIFNDRIDVLDLNVLGTLHDDDIYYEYEFVNNEDFSKRLVEPIITFEDWNTKLRIDVMGQDSDLRTDSVFYNLTDHDFEGLLKLWIKAVNGQPVDNDYYEIPVVYHKEQEHNFMLKNANISINADSSGTVRLGNIFNSGYGVGQLRNNSQLSISGLFISYSDRNVFQEAEGYFGSYGQYGGFELHNVKQNTTVNNKQTRLMIYPYFEGMTGNEDFLNDREMFPSVLLTITQESVSLSDPFVNDDRYEEGDGEADVIRLNNFVSTPITNNKYSVNMTSFTRNDYMKLTDKLYFIEASPVYVNQSVKEVTLHYVYNSWGNLYVSFLNQDAYIPCIQDVILNKPNRTVTVKLIQNRNQTSQGYVSLYDGNIGVKIGIFQTYGK